MSDDPELKAMADVKDALDRLQDNDIRQRVLRWAAERFDVILEPRSARDSADDGPSGGRQDPPGEFEHFADLLDAAGPKTDAERALVAAYWLYSRGELQFDSQSANKLLKDTGHGLTHITDAYTALKTRKPALIAQVKKAGTSKQARKSYKLTTSGESAVKAMLGHS